MLGIHTIHNISLGPDTQEDRQMHAYTRTNAHNGFTHLKQDVMFLWYYIM